MSQANMSKVLKNYKPKKEMLLGEFPYVKIIDQEDIFIDLPVAVVDFSREYDKPVLYGNYKGIPAIHEEEEVKKTLANLKKYHFTEDQGKLTETDPEAATIHAWLPKDTPVDQLLYDNGQIIWAKPVEDTKPEEGADQYGNN